MGSDRARTSYDPHQQYTSVVAQQGRVSLEADWNEAQMLASEETRRDALDFVGPAGTPDDGYAINPDLPNFDFHISPGTMYTGGVRTFLSGAAGSITYFQQPDWLTPPPPNPTPPSQEYIYLYLREQEIIATEDSDLRDPALGGPDTAARTRIIQHIERIPTTGKDCPSALAAAITRWNGEGLDFDPAHMRLRPQAKLKVSFVPTGPSDPCEPVAQGGYLGADNQFIRIQIVDDTHILWGFDDAYFLYRVDVLPDNQTLKLKSTPVDAFHQPAAGQAVQVARAIAELSNGEYIAYSGELDNQPVGLYDTVTTLAAAYNPDSQTVKLNATLPANYSDQKATPRLFLRVWNELLTFTPGTPVSLGDTGIQVTIQAPRSQHFHVADYWTFAVRPLTPNLVYPERYLADFQPPDGPRQWVCPLAVIGWTATAGAAGGATGKLIADCLNPFDNLVDLSRNRIGGCCTITVRPTDLTGNNTLQSVIDKAASSGLAKATVCLMPGIYNLTAPLRLGIQHSNLTIEACHDGAVIQAAPGSEINFLDGIIVLNRANNVSILGLRIHLPVVPFVAAGGKLSTQGGAIVGGSGGKGPAFLANLFTSIGIRCYHCAVLDISRCLFRFSIAENKNNFGVGVYASSESWGLRVRDCRFVHEEKYLASEQQLVRILMGYGIFPAITSGAPAVANKEADAAGVVITLLQDAEFRGNYFDGLMMAVYIIANTGRIDFIDNTIRECLNGLAMLTLEASASSEALNQVAVDRNHLAFGQRLQTSMLSAISDPLFQMAGALGRAFPLPKEFDTSHAIRVPAGAPAPKADVALLQSTFDKIMPVFQQGVTPSGQTVRIAETMPAPALPQEPAPVSTQPSPASATPAAPPAATPPATTPPSATPRATAPTGAAGSVSHLVELSALNFKLTAFERVALAALPRKNLGLAIRCFGNEINLPFPKLAATGWGVFVWGDPADTASTILCSDNHIRGIHATIPLIELLYIYRCTVNNNVVTNDFPYQPDPRTTTTPPQALVVFPLPVTFTGSKLQLTAITVMGNVTRGQLLAPPRVGPPAPLDNWLTFNTET